MEEREQLLKIAIVHFGFMYSGGGERTAIYEAILLRRMGHKVTCFAPAVRTDLCFPDLISRIDLRGIIPPVRMRLPLRDFTSLSASSILAPIFAKKFEGFDVILCHGQPATWISYLISRVISKPRITYLHQPTRFLYPRAIDLRVGWKTKRDFALLQAIVNATAPLVRAIDHISIVSSDRVLVNSNWIGRKVKEVYNVQPVVCPPGFDEEKFVPRLPKTDMVIKGRKVKKSFILSTNRHYPQKGLSDLVRIYSLVRKHSDAKLIVTGAFTTHTKDLRDLCIQLGLESDVFFTGQVSEDDLVRLYQNADVYAFTSPEEDFGLGPIEAMASGTPAVVWDYAGPAETVLHGVTGFKARPYDNADFASKLLLILTNNALKNKMSSAAAQHAGRNYSWFKHVKTLELILSEAAKA